MENLTELFCTVDDFCKLFLPEWNKHLLASGLKKRNRPSKLSISELMTIIIAFHQSHYRNFKNFYSGYVQRFLQREFPNLVSYNRFVELQSSILMPLCFFVLSRQATKTGLYFVDSTTLKVCHIKRGAIVKCCVWGLVKRHFPVPHFCSYSAIHFQKFHQ